MGAKDGEGFTMNVPLSTGMGDATFKRAYEELFFPAVREFKPGALLVSVGADAHYMDPLAGLTLSSRGYVDILGGMMDLAKDVCHGRIGFFLEGGYNVDALADVMAGAAGAAAKKDVKLRYTDVHDAGGRPGDALSSIRAVQEKYWRLG